MKIPEYIYLLQEREFIKTKESIFKIGKSKQKNDKRSSQYPKNSNLLLHTSCSNCAKYEKQLIALFKIKYKQRTDIGTEYFEGDYKQMKKDINEFLYENDTEDCDSDDDCNDDYDDECKFELNNKLQNIRPEIKFIKILIENKLKKHIRPIIRKELIKASEMHLSYKKWCKDKSYKYSISLFKKHIKLLGIECKNKTYYNINTVNGITLKCYIFNDKEINKIEKKFASYLKYPDFKFTFQHNKNTDSDEDD